MERESIYFFHIPKTAGVSTTHFLQQSFAPEEMCPHWLWDQLITVPRDQLNRWRVFRGHFQSHLEPYLRRPLKAFTMLREPVARSISNYFHIRKDPQHPLYPQARRLSLLEFCKDPETRFIVENYQAHWLAKSATDPVEASRDLSAIDLEHFVLQERMHRPDSFGNPSQLLQAAEERLDTFAAVGFVEHFSESLLRVSRALKCPPPGSFEHDNANPEPVRPGDLDPQTLECVRELTKVDEDLYRRALTRWQGSCAVPELSVNLRHG